MALRFQGVSAYFGTTWKFLSAPKVWFTGTPPCYFCRSCKGIKPNVNQRFCNVYKPKYQMKI